MYSPFVCCRRNIVKEHYSFSAKIPAYEKCEIKQEFSEKADDMICYYELIDIQLLLE